MAAVVAGHRLTQKQVAALCVSVGWTVANARIAAAISMCEAPYSINGVSYSDFDMIGDQALANATWGFSYSGFQVRSLRAHKGTGRLRDELLLPDPAFAATSALAIFKAQGFAAWSTWTTGMFRAYLQDEYPPAPGTYVVVGGDTLTKITNRLALPGIAWQDLARVNGLKSPYTIFIGQVLLLPWFVYTVQPGDTLARIADVYGEGVTYARIAEFNGITDPSKIAVGQLIKIPRSTL